jgi:hypothetical protein
MYPVKTYPTPYFPSKINNQASSEEEKDSISKKEVQDTSKDDAALKKLAEDLEHQLNSSQACCIL